MPSESEEWTISADFGAALEDLEVDFVVDFAGEALGFGAVVLRVEALRSRRTVGVGFFVVDVGFFDTSAAGSGDLRFRAAGAGFVLAAEVGALRAGSKGVFAALPVPVR